MRGADESPHELTLAELEAVVDAFAVRAREAAALAEAEDDEAAGAEAAVAVTDDAAVHDHLAPDELFASSPRGGRRVVSCCC